MALRADRRRILRLVLRQGSALPRWRGAAYLALEPISQVVPRYIELVVGLQTDPELCGVAEVLGEP
jgi:hypothetical protein